MKRKLITLIATIAVTGTLVSTPAAFASNGKAPTNLPATQTSEQVQLQTHKFEPSIKKVPSGDNFVYQSHRNFPGQMIDTDQDGVCDNLGTDGIQDHKLDGTGKKTSTKNVTINKGSGKKIATQKSGTKKVTIKKVAVKNGSGEKNFVDTNQAGLCDKLGTGKIKNPKQDSTGKVEYHAKGHGAGHHK